MGVLLVLAVLAAILTVGILMAWALSPIALLIAVALVVAIVFGLVVLGTADSARRTDP